METRTAEQLRILFAYARTLHYAYDKMNDDYNDFPRCTYTVPKNLPEGVRRLQVGYKLFTDDVGYTIQYLPTTSTRRLHNVYRRHHPPQKKKSSPDDNYKISETD